MQVSAVYISEANEVYDLHIALTTFLNSYGWAFIQEIPIKPKKVISIYWFGNFMGNPCVPTGIRRVLFGCAVKVNGIYLSSIYFYTYLPHSGHNPCEESIRLQSSPITKRCCRSKHGVMHSMSPTRYTWFFKVNYMMFSIGGIFGRCFGRRESPLSKAHHTIYWKRHYWLQTG